MGLFNLDGFVVSKHGLTCHALTDWRLLGALVLSMGVHAAVVSLESPNPAQVLPTGQRLKAPHFDVNIIASAVVQDHLSNKAAQPVPLVTKVNQPGTVEDHTPVTVTASMTSDPLPANDLQDAVQGMRVGSFGFAGFAGARKKPFEPISSGSEGHAQPHRGEGLEPGSREMLLQAVMRGIKNDLSRAVAPEAGQLCQLTTLVACEKKNEDLEKYLQRKAPLLQQLTGGRAIKVMTENGEWKVEAL